jgi:hypothetical protein
MILPSSWADQRTSTRTTSERYAGASMDMDMDEAAPLGAHNLFVIRFACPLASASWDTLSRRRPRGAHVQEKACVALGSLVRDVEHRAPVVRAGGIDAAVAAPREHPASEALQERKGTTRGTNLTDAVRGQCSAARHVGLSVDVFGGARGLQRRWAQHLVCAASQRRAAGSKRGSRQPILVCSKADQEARHRSAPTGLQEATESYRVRPLARSGSRVPPVSPEH